MKFNELDEVGRFLISIIALINFDHIFTVKLALFICIWVKYTKTSPTSQRSDFLHLHPRHCMPHSRNEAWGNPGLQGIQKKCTGNQYDQYNILHKRLRLLVVFFLNTYIYIYIQTYSINISIYCIFINIHIYVQKLKN